MHTINSSLIAPEGEAHTLLTALIIKIHRLSTRSIDHLEMLCAEQQKLRISHLVLQQLPDYLLFIGERENAKQKASEFGLDVSQGERIIDHPSFMDRIFSWLEATGLENLNGTTLIYTIRIALSVVMSVDLYGRQRSMRLQEYIMDVLEKVQIGVQLEGVSVPKGVELQPPQLPAYSPIFETAADYLQYCEKQLRFYIDRLDREYKTSGNKAREQTRKEDLHIELLALTYLKKSSVRELAREFNMSPSSVSEALAKLRRRIGIDSQP